MIAAVSISAQGAAQLGLWFGLSSLCIWAASQQATISRALRAVTAGFALLPVLWFATLVALCCQVWVETGALPQRPEHELVDGRFPLYIGSAPEHYALGLPLVLAFFASIFSPLAFLPLAVARWRNDPSVARWTAIWLGTTALFWGFLLLDPGELATWHLMEAR